MAPAAALTQRQLHALFDILTHHETYAEIEGFKSADAVTHYGYPFTRTTQPDLLSGDKSGATTPGTPRARTPVPPGDFSDDDADEPSGSPLLQGLLTRFVLPLPGVSQLPRPFWAVRMQGLLARLAQAGLSESYDKGALGTRKTLATGASAVIEMLGRGALGGVRRRGAEGKTGEYDAAKAEDLERAWEDVVDGLVYGDLVDGLFDHLAKTDDLESCSLAVKAAADYSIIHLATLVHHVFVLSPEGQYLLKLMENVHNLLPYKMVKQTLRVGNAATMINGMLRLLLAKLSVTSLTNWVGLTQNADDGMNLLQRIISLVLSWDANEFKKGIDKVEKSKDKPSDEALHAIRQYVNASKAEHDSVRTASQEHGQSIITAIFNASNPELAAQLTDAEHTQCLEYYSALLSVRDREAITTVLCRQPPDLFTQAIKDAVGAYEPIIRTVHSGVDLREHLEATQGFIEDFIKASKPKKAGDGTRMASVEDYVELLRKNRPVMYRWIHALAGGCPDVWGDFRAWMKDAAGKFRKGDDSEKPTEGEKTKSEDASKSMDDRLIKLFTSLPQNAQDTVLPAIDAHADYLSTLSAQSRARLQYLITHTDSDDGTMEGPGVYLARWQNLLDTTMVTPQTVGGQVRHGADVKHATTMGKTGLGDSTAVEKAQEEAAEGTPAPDVGVVVKEMGGGFKGVMEEVGGRR